MEQTELVEVPRQVRLSRTYIRLVLDGLEGAPYKRVQKVQLFQSLPLTIRELFQPKQKEKRKRTEVIQTGQ